MNIAIDFDGTVVEHEYPKIGREIPFAVDTLKMLIRDRHNLILWSCREGQLLDDAVEWCRKRGIEFYAVNRDYPEEQKEGNRSFSRKLKVDLFIDDRNVGGLPEWGVIYQMISEKKTYEQVMRERLGHTDQRNADTGGAENNTHKHNKTTRYEKYQPTFVS